MLSRIHGGNLHQMHVNQRKSLLSSKHMLYEQSMKIMLMEVSNTSWMFNTNNGEDNNVADGLTNNSSRFPRRWNSIIM